MDKATRKAIEDAGFRVTTGKELLGLTEEENQIVELRVALNRRVRERAGAEPTHPATIGFQAEVEPIAAWPRSSARTPESRSI